MSTDAAVKLPKEAWPTVEELPDGDLRRIAGKMGMETLMELYGMFSSTHVYFGHFDKFLKAHRNQMIRREFDALTLSLSARKAIAALARKYDLSDRWVWDIVGRPDERQLGMWTK